MPFRPTFANEALANAMNTSIVYVISFTHNMTQNANISCIFSVTTEELCVMLIIDLFDVMLQCLLNQTERKLYHLNASFKHMKDTIEKKKSFRVS